MSVRGRAEVLDPGLSLRVFHHDFNEQRTTAFAAPARRLDRIAREQALIAFAWVVLAVLVGLVAFRNFGNNKIGVFVSQLFIEGFGHAGSVASNEMSR